MSLTTTRQTSAQPTGPTCTPAVRATRSLLGYGVVAGPLFVAVTLAQAFTREGFDLGRHQWSLLANGDHGWVQVANFVLAGLMTVGYAVGLGRALGTGRASRWAPRLVAAYGLSLVAAGVFRADPALGFPLGTPDGPGTISGHGILHLVSGAVGFTCISVACFLLARRYADEGRRAFAAFSVLTGAAFLTGFGMIASTQGSAVATRVSTAAVILVWGWMAAVAVDRYRTGELARTR